MGLWDRWSRFRDNFHESRESDQRAAHRLAHTPPEMWSRSDWPLSRRLRYLREKAIREAIRKGRNPQTVDVKYPEGPFWPWTQLNVEHRRKNYVDERFFEVMKKHMEPGLELFKDGNGQLWVWNSDTGEIIYQLS